MGVLTYIITIRLKKIFDFKAHALKSVAIILFLSIAVFYGVVFALFSNFLTPQKAIISQKIFNQYLVLFLIIITFLRSFLPQYIPLKNIFAKHYPLNKKKRFTYNLSLEFVCPFYLGIFLFIVAFSLFVEKSGSVFFVLAFSGIIISHLLKRLLQYSIEFRFEKIKSIFILLTTIVSIIVVFLFFSIETGYFNYAVSTIVITVLLLINYLFEINVAESVPSTENSTRKNSRNLFSLKLILKNSSLRTMLIFSVIMKIIFAFFCWVNISEQVGEFYVLYIYANLVLSPLILFSYIFNNFFGFLKSVWLSMNNVGAEPFYYIIIMTKVFAIPLMIDAIVTFISFVFLDMFSTANVIVYLTNSILLFSFGVVNSFYFPKKTQNVFSLRATTSSLGGIISVIVIIINILLAIISPLLTLFFSVLAAFGLYFWFRGRILNTRHKLFQVFFS